MPLCAEQQECWPGCARVCAWCRRPPCCSDANPTVGFWRAIILLQCAQLLCKRVAQVSKALACGDVGLGAMAAPQTIASAVRGALPG